MQEMNVNDINSHLASEFLKEKRSERRWRNFRFAAWFALICFALFNLLNINTPSLHGKKGSEKSVALIRLDGMIAPEREFYFQIQKSTLMR